jgi:peptidoglycan/xylan/chitin deacetylase (PgdA/CDA1 family)
MIYVRDDDIFLNVFWRHQVFLKYKIFVHIGIIGSRPFPSRWIKKNLKMYEICNHSYSHKCDKLVNMDLESQINDIEKANEIIKKKLGVTPRYFIPPCGRYNDQLIKACEKVGLTLHPSYVLREKNEELYHSANLTDLFGKKEGWYICHTSKGMPSQKRLEWNLKYLSENKLTQFFK